MRTRQENQLDPLKAERKIDQLVDLQVQNALLSAGIILQTEHSTKAAGVGLIIIWLGVTFLAQIICSQSQSNKGKDTFYAILLGLLLIQTRTILRIEDEFGLTQYFLIALGLAASASFSRKQWLRLLQWMGATAIPILILLIGEIVMTKLDISSPLPAPIPSIAQALVDTSELRSYLQETVFSFLAISGLIAGRLSQKCFTRIISYAGGLCGLILCQIVDSRMAIIAPILGITIGFGICHLATLKRVSSKIRLAILSSFTAALLVIIFTVVIAPDLRPGSGVTLDSDRGRINIALCWAGSIFAGNNRFLYGTGHDKTFIMERCTDEKVGNYWQAKPGNNTGHAHNVFAHIIGLHGVLGIIAMGLLATIYIKGVLYFAKTEEIFASLPIGYAPWSEAIISMGVFMLVCSMSTTFFIYNHTLQVLIGLALGMPLIKLTPSK